MEKLLIIESPNKIKTLNKYLGSEYEILATIGHIRDLSPFAMGFDKETLEPKWIIPNPKKLGRNEKSKKEIIEEIKKEASKAKEIYLATDPDREGEAIAWHVYEILDKDDQKKCKRITFNEITKSAILESFEHKRDINIPWVQSQFARRIIDRMIGFKLSKLIQIKLKAESAGRVQSVALKFLEDREKEINSFVAENWWTIDATLLDDNQLIYKTPSSSLKNLNISEKNFSTGVNLADEKSADLILKDLKKEFKVIEILEPSFYSTNPKQPYKTSTLQQDGINKLKWSAKKITSVAQRLYEGVEIDGNQVALISYPRTDSVRLSESFLNSSKEFIVKTYGKEFLGNIANKSQAASGENVQDAHEAIRPIDTSMTPESLKNKLSKDDLALYQLIWLRTTASLMSAAKFKKITINLDNNGHLFYTFSRVCEFEGYRKIYKHTEDEDADKIIDINNYKIDSLIKSKSIVSTPHQTAPPPRYTQASLIADLEKAGVGRPSTYSSMANVAIDRGYANLDKRAFVMTEIGKIVIEALEKYFPDVINKGFTKEMEEHLDKIAQGEEGWKIWMQAFFPAFNEEVNLAYEKMEKVQDEKVGRLCPNCGHELLIKHARGGNKFIGCSNFPECKYLEPLEKPEILKDKCPECGSDLLMRKSKKGQKFVGCSGYPKCTYLLGEKAYNELISKPDYKMPTKEEIANQKLNSYSSRFKKKEPAKPLSTFSDEDENKS